MFKSRSIRLHPVEMVIIFLNALFVSLIFFAVGVACYKIDELFLAFGFITASVIYVGLITVTLSGYGLSRTK